MVWSKLEAKIMCLSNQADGSLPLPSTLKKLLNNAIVVAYIKS